MSPGGVERSDGGTDPGGRDLDRLYGVDPAEFTGLRTELVAAAKKRGDLGAARSIGAARRPTTAAWVVNVIVRVDGTAASRLDGLGQRLRAAHAAMDGTKIREMSAVQRALIDELVRTGIAAANITNPSSALRDDVVGTLQAAVADPDVAARLGRLVKAERWSGFGEFGTVSAVGPAAKPAPKTTFKAESNADEADLAAARQRVEQARAGADGARQKHDAATEVLSTRAATLGAARRRYEKLLASLSAAEHAVDTAEADRVDAEEAARATAVAAEAASSLLAEAETELQRLAAKTDSSS